MSPVVDHLAELTGSRDRDLLDVTLAVALKDLLSPSHVAIYRAVGEEGEQRWLSRALWSDGDPAPTADPVWIDPEQLPLLSAAPERALCLTRGEALTVDVGPGCRSYFPVDADSDVPGVLELHTPQPLSTEAVRLASSVLRIYRNFQGVLDDSERDSLTRLLNRKTFDSHFLRAVTTHAQAPADAHLKPLSGRNVGGGSAWLGVVDIDHFKRVNDTWGHLIGDEVLLLLSRLMRSSFRFHDHLFRFGGEEFVVLMRNGDAAAAAQAFERLRANVERYTFPQVGRITVSLGYTELRLYDTPSAAFERADKAVYFAKQHGRNQVCHHAELVARGELNDEARDNSDAELF